MRNDTCIHCEYPIRNGVCACTDRNNLVPEPALTDKAEFASTDWVGDGTRSPDANVEAVRESLLKRSSVGCPPPVSERELGIDLKTLQPNTLTIGKSVTTIGASAFVPAPCSAFVLLKIWYDGDSNMVDDSFVSVSFNLSSLLSLVSSTATVFKPGEKVPDDGQYGDERERYRIIEVVVSPNDVSATQST